MSCTSAAGRQRTAKGQPLHSLPHIDCTVLMFSAGRGASSDSASICFLYKLRPGVCPSSYGLEVAALAGIPRSITQRAHHAGAVFEGKLEAAFAAAQHPPLSAEELWLVGRLRDLCNGKGLYSGDGLDVVVDLWRKVHAVVV